MVPTRHFRRWLLPVSALAVYACVAGVPNIFAEPGADSVNLPASPIPVPPSADPRMETLRTRKQRTTGEPRTVDQQLRLASDYLSGRGVGQDFSMAEHWYQKAAEAGDPWAEMQVGYFYDAGIGVTRDPALAAHWYQLSAAGGYGLAKVNLAILYFWGTGVAQDRIMAEHLLREAAAEGYGLAACYLGNFYRFGIGVPQDNAAAKKWYERGAKLHNPQAELNFATILVSENSARSLHQADELMRSAVAKGYVPAIHALGLFLTRNPSFIRSKSEVTALLNQSASAGVWQSSMLLGVIARDGIASVPDQQAAYYHFRVAAIQGGDKIAKLAGSDLDKLAAVIGLEKSRTLDEQAREWASSHAIRLEFVDQREDNQSKYPALALAAPQDGNHTLQLLPPLPN